MSDVFALATEDRDALDEAARLNPFDPSKLPPSAFEGSIDQLKGLMRPSAGAGRSLMMAGAPVAQAMDWIANLNPARPEDQRDAWMTSYFQGVEDYGSSAVDFWTADPQSAGSAAKAVGVLSNVAGTIPQMFTPALFLANAGIDPATELVRQGVDPGTAGAVGAVNLAANAAGMKLPAAFGSTLATRVATGAGANLAVGTAADATSGAVLDAAGYAQQAEGYNAADPYARGLDALMGAAFGVKAHIDAPATAGSPAPLAQRDAVLLARNHDHLTRRTLPGEPVTPRAQRQSTDATIEAMAQMLRGEPVDVAATIDPAQYRMPSSAVEKQEVGTFDTAIAGVMKAEGGYVNDPADRGGETNFGISKRAHPGVDIKNLTREQAADIYRREYWDAIKADALPPEIREVAFDAAVNQGVGWTRKALKAAGGDPAKFLELRRARYREIIAANPSQAKFARGWENRLSRFEPAPRQPFADPDALAESRVQEFAQRYELPAEQVRAIAAPAARDSVTGFYDGRADGVKANLIGRAITHVETTGEAGHYVAVDVSNLGGLNEAMGNRAEAANVHYAALSDILAKSLRTEGVDVVPMRTGGDEFGALVINARAEDVDAAIVRAQAQVAEYVQREGLADIPHPKRSGEKGVGLHIGRAEIAPGESVRTILDRADDGINNSKARTSNGVRTATGPARPAAPEGRPGGVAGGDPAADGGVRRPGGGEQGAGGSGADPGPAAAGRTALDDVAQIAADRPSVQVATGFDADGQPIYEPIDNALAAIEAERAQAVRDAGAFDAAVSCFNRRGMRAA